MVPTQADHGGAGRLAGLMPSQKSEECATISNHEVEKISGEDLASLVVDALLRADIVGDADVERAIAIAAEEIEVRKILGDY